ncbi:MAG: NAD(P)-binding domain-containing protein [Hyphomicrobiaceae bacterium]|mgnify:CR=1 FL=1
MTTIGFIGLGRMGRPMAANLQRKGFSLVVHDINPEPIRVLEELGARRGNGAAGVAQASDIVVTMLPASPEVEATVLGSDGVLANAKPGAIIMDMSTVEPRTTDLIAKEAQARGMSVVDAPVGRVAWHADRGESLFMVGASDADFQKVLPLLQAMGTTIHHCGGVGTGTRTKLVNNYLAIVLCQLNAEALALSQRFGLDLVKTLEVLHGTTATNGQLKINWPNKVLAGDITPGFTIDLAHKDLSLILSSASAAKVPMPVAAAAREFFSLARASGDGGNDFSSIVDTLCEMTGIEKPRLPKA